MQNNKYIILCGSGNPSNYAEKGSYMRLKHDQSRKDLGSWKVVTSIKSEDLNSLPIKDAIPLYVYK